MALYEARFGLVRVFFSTGVQYTCSLRIQRKYKQGILSYYRVPGPGCPSDDPLPPILLTPRPT